MSFFLFYRDEGIMTTFIDPATGYEVRVIRKPIRRIYLRVREGKSVEVTAPRKVSEREIRDFVAGKTAWLTKYMALVPEKIDFRYVNGEIHHVFGRAYPLQVFLGQHDEAGISSFGELQLVLRTEQSDRKAIFKEGMKRILLLEIVQCLKKWTKRMEIPESRITGVTIRVMKSRWGSCRRVTGRFSFALDLVTKPKECIEAVVVHELCHLTHMNHSKDFWNMVERIMPDYRIYKQWLREHGQELTLTTHLKKQGIPIRLG